MTIAVPDNALFDAIWRLFRSEQSIKMAVIVVSTVPILCVYPFLQKYFVKGVMTGALKPEGTLSVKL